MLKGYGIQGRRMENFEAVLSFSQDIQLGEINKEILLNIVHYYVQNK